MKLLMLGAHQRTTPVALLEQYMVSAALLPQALHQLHQQVAEGMIISTCNRIEVYAVVPEIEAGVAAIKTFLADWREQQSQHIQRTEANTEQPQWDCFTEDEVVRHIFQLAAGLDSLVLGDDQIMGQIKTAQAAARLAGTSGKVLHRLAQQALASGKLVRTATQIASQPVSVISVALKQAQRHIGNLSQRRCLVIGAGHMAQLALKLLHTKYAPHLSIINRTDEHAEALASHYAASAWPYAALEEALAAHDVILCATAAPHFVVTHSMIGHSQQETPRLFLDLSVPRGIDPAGIAASNDELFDIDALQIISAENHAIRAREIMQSNALIEPEVAAFMAWRAEQSVVPAIRELKAYAEQIRVAELRRALAHLPSLTPEQEQTIQAMTAAIVNKLLHQPIMALKDPESGLETAQTLTRVFQLPTASSQETELTNMSNTANIAYITEEANAR